MTSADANTGFPKGRLRRRRRRPSRPAEAFVSSFQFRPGLDVMEDRTLLSSFLVNTTADSGPGSLRQAILDSNAAPGAMNTVEFDIPGTGTETIEPAEPLPPITQAVLIDGFSQPGYSGMPLIEVSGSQAGFGDGLVITAANVTVRGLDIDSFSQGAGIHVTGTTATGDWIYGNFIGTDPTGTQAESNVEGVEIDGGAAQNLIGTNGDGVNDTAERNLLSGNLFAGVFITGAGTSNNAVAGNDIGTDVTGSFAINNGTQPVGDSLGDYFGGGVAISGGASSNRIGTDGASVDDVGERNVIAGSDNDAIDIWGSGTDGNVIAGNFIGTDATGAYSLGIAGDGVFLAEGASFNWIGVNPVSGPAVGDLGNVISGTGYDGIQLVNGADGNVIAGNQIGTDATGTLPLGNSDQGVEVDGGCTDETIGGAAPSSGNVISANGGYGVWISGEGATGNVVQGNLIGTDRTGTISLGNAKSGVQVDGGADSNTIGGTTAAAGNLISENDGSGVAVVGATSVGDQITANRIFGNSGDAIDLGGDGVTYNSTSPRQGPNNLQNYPIIATTSAGLIEGWLGGDLPETTFRIDVFASADYEPNGAGEAEDYLGSMAVTTDSSGQAVFIVPFTQPAGLSVVTATATDPQGDTSEVSPLRRTTLAAPTQTVCFDPGRSAIFSAISGNGITLQDPDAGPLDPVWDLTLSVSAGTLTLGTTAGLTGSGDGTATLSYTGQLSALNAALDGMSFTLAKAQGVAELSLSAESPGASPLEGQVIVSDGLFTVDTTADSGPGSLRQAILDSNIVTSGSDAIDFAIPGKGLQTIVLASPLPAITTSVLIDGFSQPGYAGTPLIAIDAQATGGSDELTVTGSNVTVRGLALESVELGAGDVAEALTFPSGSLPQLGQSVGGVGSGLYRIDTAADGLLEAIVDPVGFTTRLSLLDSHGDVLVQSDGLAAAGPGDMIDEHVAAGTYFLEVESTAGAGDYSLTTTFTPASAPFQPAAISPFGPAYIEQPLGAIGDFNGDGIIDLAGLDGVHIGLGDGTFMEPSAGLGLLDLYDSYTSMVAGDFTGNGKLDLALTDSTTSTVVVLLGNGNGTFQPPETFPVGADPEAMVEGDFNGDGKLDLISANASGTISVLLGNGDGTFQPATNVPAGSQPYAIVSGDFNGDGKLDVAVAAGGRGIGPSSLFVLMGDGDGTFQPAKSYVIGNGTGSAIPTPGALVAGDFTGNGRLDLAVLSVSENVNVPGEIFYFGGNGDGTFQPSKSIGYAAVTYIYPTNLVAGDFGGDGRLGLAVKNDFGALSILLGNGDGTFQAPKPVAGSYGGDLLAADLTDDGRVDLVDFGTDGITVLLGNGDGTFETAPQSETGTDPLSLVEGDFTGDGNLDLATANADGSISILLGNGDGTFEPAEQFLPGVPTGAMVSGDFNGDGRLDLAMLDPGNLPEGGSDPGALYILLGNGDGTFEVGSAISVGTDPVALVAGDFNGDGNLDLAIADRGTLFDTGADPGGVVVLMGNGDGTFQPARYYQVGNSPGGLVAGTFTGDGRLDLVVSDADGVQMMLGNADGTFQPAKTITADAGIDGSLVAGDFNNDGHLDLSTGDVVLLGNGDGTFQPPEQVSTEPVFGLVAGDFAGPDQPLDLAFATASNVEVLMGNGDGTFQSPQQYAAGSNPVFLVAGDFHGGGKLDLAVGDADVSSIAVLLGNGDGTLVDPSTFAITPRSTPLVADVNGDGTDDTLVVDGSGDILYRQGIPGHPGSFEPPVSVQAVINGSPQYPSRDIAWVANSGDGPLLASVDSGDDAVSLFAYRNGEFVRIGSLSTGALPAQIIATDLNGDGWDDLVARNAGDGTLSVYFNAADTAVPGPAFVGPKTTGMQLFGIPITLPAGLGVSDVEAVDAAGGGRLDLVTSNKLTGQVSVFLNLGGTNFAAPVLYRAGDGLSEVDPGSTPEVTSLDATAGVAAGALAAGDPTSLVTINPGSNTLDVLAAIGGGGFANPVAIETQSAAEVVRAGDFTANGILDLAILSAAGLSIYLGNGNGGFSSPTTYAVPAGSDGLTIADVNHDGNPDLLVGDAYGDVLLLLGNGNGTFQPYRDANQSIALAVADLTGNGSKDVIYADDSLDRVVVDYGAGASAVLADPSTGLLEPGAVQLAYLAGPSYPPDLIVANSGSNNVLIYPGLGNGQFGPGINGGNGYFVGTNPVGITVADLTGALPDLVVADKGSNQVSILVNTSEGAKVSFSAGPRLNAGGSGPVSTTVGNFTGGLNPDILVTNSGSNDVTLLRGAGGVFFHDQNPPTSPVGDDPVTTVVGNFNGNTGVLTVNAGSNDLTLISDYGGPDPVTSTISSGGVDPDTAFVFSSGGFDDAVVGNSGDGVLALFEGGSSGLTLMSAQVEPNLPSPTDMAFSALAGGQVQFYAATAGREAATLVSLSLSGETLAQTPAVSALSTVNNVAQLVPLDESSLVLVTSLLTLTVAATEGDFSLEAAQSEAEISVGSISVSSASLGQSLFRQSGRDLGGTDDAVKAGESLDSAGPAWSTVSPWERFMLGLDQALEQFRLEFQGRILGPHDQATERDQQKPKPAADASSATAPSSDRSNSGSLLNDVDDAPPIENPPEADRGAAIDASIDRIWVEDVAGRDPSARRMPGAPIAFTIAESGREYSELGPSRFFALERRLNGSFERLTRARRDEPIVPSLPLLAATFVTGWTWLTRYPSARSSRTANFSRLTRPDRLARISRTGNA